MRRRALAITLVLAVGVSASAKVADAVPQPQDVVGFSQGAALEYKPGATSPLTRNGLSALSGDSLQLAQSTISRRKGSDKRQEAPPSPSPAPQQASPPAVPLAADPIPAQPPAEAIEIDVSTRNVAITSTFAGTEIVVFGSVENSRQPSAESGYYDLVVIVDGITAPAIVREKKRVFGIWVNADRMRFETLPLYRAVASNRPLEEIADNPVLAMNRITLDHFMRAPGSNSKAQKFGAAAARLKQRDGLYVEKSYGAAFIGKSLFRASVKLPANIPVGPLEVRVMLFREGQLLAARSAPVRLEREGLERLIYDFAYEQPFWHGILAVGLALGAGLLASAVFQRAQA